MVKNGSIRLQDSDHASRTLHEYPTVVDVDGDNEPEIVVPNGGGHNNEDARGVYIIGAADTPGLVVQRFGISTHFLTPI